MSLQFVEFDLSVICHVLVSCFGSILLQDMFLSLEVFAFEEKKYDVYCERVGYLLSIL